jgi:redox-sensitive bicupin YhaK (pirin superfamily)
MRSLTLKKLKGLLSIDRFKSENLNVSVQIYQKGESDFSHYHKVCNILIYIAYGRVKICDSEYVEDDVVIFSVRESIEIKALEKSKIILLKSPDVEGDVVMD